MSRFVLLVVALTCAVLLLAAGPAAAALYTPQECVDCHTGVTPGIVTQLSLIHI